MYDKQAQHLKELHHQGLIDDFRHMELQKILYDFYVHQGKCERIKKFPLPRQYGSASFIFVGIFIFLLPFGMVSEFQKLGAGGAWLAIPFSVLVGWVYLFMELVGDYSENPFEGLGNDIPMLALSRTIEIDLLEMLGEKELPEGIKAKRGVLM
ncbi:MAG: bestrophin family ion channel [Bacteroidota bacterium]